MAATRAPEVGYLSASNVTMTGATIGASINPESGETAYEIWLECQSPPGSSQTCEPLTVDRQLRKGVLPAYPIPETVTAAVTGLQPGYLYDYRVVATNSAGREGIVGAGFITCPSQGSCPSQPYLPGESLWSLEGAERAAREAPRREAEREAMQREREAREREEAERPAKEAAARAAWERGIREAGERAGREKARRAALAHSCVVPRLEGDSLRAATRALHGARCALGKVTEPRRHHGPLVVIGQSVPGGSRLAPGSRVALRLGNRA